MAANGPAEQSDNSSKNNQPSGRSFTISGRTLMIAGGVGGVALVVVVAVVAWQVGLFTGGGRGATGGGAVLGYIPADAGLVVIGDNEAILNGDVPEDYVEHLEEEADDSAGFGDSYLYEELDVDDGDVSLVAFAHDHANAESLEIVRGDFDFDVIREELEDGLDCEDDDFRGFELWECPGGLFPAVALFEKDGYLVFAVSSQDDLEDMLTYKARDPEKLAEGDNSDIKRVLDRTDGGWLQVAVITENCPINRCQGFALAIGKSHDSESIPASYAVMFSSERAAAGAEDDIEIDDLIERFFAEFALELDIEDVMADGDFVVGDGTAEFVDPGDARSSNQVRGHAQSPPVAQTTAVQALAVLRTAMPAVWDATVTSKAPQARRTAQHGKQRNLRCIGKAQITVRQTRFTTS